MRSISRAIHGLLVAGHLAIVFAYHPVVENLVGPRHNRGPFPHHIAVFHEQRQMSFDAFLIGVFAYPAVCRDIPNQLLVYRVGIYWFSAFTLIALCSYAAGDLITRSPFHARDMLTTGLVSTATI